MTDWKKKYPVGAKVKLTNYGLRIWGTGYKYQNTIFVVSAYAEETFNGRRFNQITHPNTGGHFLWVYDNPGTSCFELVSLSGSFEYEPADCNLP